jgi:uncharacterized protein YbjT (DUF2867 family)
VQARASAARVKILLFGATGSAGGSVLKVCLQSAAVEEIRVILRRPLELTHERLRQFVHADFTDYRRVEGAFDGADACFFCLGISILQVSGEAEYRRITHDFAVAAAETLRARSPSGVFHFISGQGTSEASRLRWARIKGQTERELIEKFGAVCWRPGAIDGEPSSHAPLLYKVFRPAYRLLKPFRSLYVSGDDLGRAMLQATAEGMRGRILENREIRAIAERVAHRP